MGGLHALSRCKPGSASVQRPLVGGFGLGGLGGGDLARGMCAITDPASDCTFFGVSAFGFCSSLPPSVFTFGDVVGFLGSPFGEVRGSMWRSSEAASDRRWACVNALGVLRPSPAAALTGADVFTGGLRGGVGFEPDSPLGGPGCLVGGFAIACESPVDTSS